MSIKNNYTIPIITLGLILGVIFGFNIGVYQGKKEIEEEFKSPVLTGCVSSVCVIETSAGRIFIAIKKGGATQKLDNHLSTDNK